MTLKKFLKTSNNHCNPIKKINDQRHEAKESAVAQMRMQQQQAYAQLDESFAASKEALTKERAKLNSSAKAESSAATHNIEQELLLLGSVQAAIKACITDTNLAAIDTIFNIYAANKKLSIDEFIFCNPLGIAITFDSYKAIDLILRKFGSYIDPEAVTITGRTVIDALKCSSNVKVINKIIHLRNTNSSRTKQNAALKLLQEIWGVKDEILAGDINVVQVDVNAGVQAGYTKLSYYLLKYYEASSRGNLTVISQYLQIIRLLLVAGADISKNDKHGNNPLSILVAHHDAELLDLTISSKRILNKNALNAALTLAKSFNYTPVIDLLNFAAFMNEHCDSISDIFTAATENGHTALTMAATKADAKMVANLLNIGANVNQPSADGLTALHYAIKQNKFSVLVALVTHHADIELPYVDISKPAAKAVSPLELAQKFNFNQAYQYIQLSKQVRKFISSFMPPEEQLKLSTDNYLKKIGMLAVEHDNVLLIEWLHESGFDLNAKYSLGATLMNTAYNANKTSMLQALYANGARPDAVLLTKANDLLRQNNITDRLFAASQTLFDLLAQRTAPKSDGSVRNIEIQSDNMTWLPGSLAEALILDIAKYRDVISDGKISALLEHLDNDKTYKYREAAKTLIIASGLFRIAKLHATGRRLVNAVAYNFVWDFTTGQALFAGDMIESRQDLALAREAVKQYCESCCSAIGELTGSTNSELRSLIQLPAADKIENISLQMVANLKDIIPATMPKVVPESGSIKMAKLQRNIILRYVQNSSLLIPAHVPSALRALILILRQEQVKNISDVIDSLNALHCVSGNSIYCIDNDVPHENNIYACALVGLQKIFAANKSLATMHALTLKNEVKNYLQTQTDNLHEDFDKMNSLQQFLIGVSMLYQVQIRLVLSTRELKIGLPVFVNTLNLALEDACYYLLKPVPTNTLDTQVKAIISNYYFQSTQNGDNDLAVTDFKQVTFSAKPKHSDLMALVLSINCLQAKPSRFVELAHNNDNPVEIADKLHTALRDVTGNCLLEKAARYLNICINEYVESQVGMYTLLNSEQQICGILQSKSYMPKVASNSKLQSVAVLKKLDEQNETYIALALNNTQCWLLPPESFKNVASKDIARPVILAAKQHNWLKLKTILKNVSPSGTNAEVLAFDSDSGETLVEIIESIVEKFTSQAESAASKAANQALRAVNLLQFLHFQGITAAPAVAYSIASELAKEEWISQSALKDFELRAKYAELLKIEENKGGLSYDDLSLAILAIMFRLKISVLDDAGVVSEVFGEEQWSVLNVSKNTRQHKLELISACLQMAKSTKCLMANLSVDQVLEQISTQCAQAICDYTDDEKHQLRREILPYVNRANKFAEHSHIRRIVDDELIRYVEQARELYQQKLPEIQENIRKAVAEANAKLDEFALKLETDYKTLRDQIHVDYSSTMQESVDQIDAGYRKAKRKMVRQLALTLPLICAAAYAAPALAGVLGTSFTTGIQFALVKGVMMSTAVAIGQGRLDPDKFLKGVLGAAIGYGIGNGLCEYLEFAEHTRSAEFIHAASNSFALNVLNGEIIRALPTAVLDGSIQVLSSQIADILVDIKTDVNKVVDPKLEFNLKEIPHYFIVGSSASILHALERKMMYGEMDFSQLVTDGVQAIFTHWATKAGMHQRDINLKKHEAAAKQTRTMVKLAVNTNSVTGATAAASAGNTDFLTAPRQSKPAPTNSVPVAPVKVKPAAQEAAPGVKLPAKKDSERAKIPKSKNKTSRSRNSDFVPFMPDLFNEEAGDVKLGSRKKAGAAKQETKPVVTVAAPKVNREASTTNRRIFIDTIDEQGQGRENYHLSFGRPARDVSLISTVVNYAVDGFKSRATLNLEEALKLKETRFLKKYAYEVPHQLYTAGNFILEEGGRFITGQNTNTGNAIKYLGTITGEDFARWNRGENSYLKYTLTERGWSRTASGAAQFLGETSHDVYNFIINATVEDYATGCANVTTGLVGNKLLSTGIKGITYVGNTTFQSAQKLTLLYDVSKRKIAPYQSIKPNQNTEFLSFSQEGRNLGSGAKHQNISVDPRASYPKASMAELLNSSGKIDPRGITLTDCQVNFTDLWKLTVKHEGIEVAVTREIIGGKGVFRIYGGDLQMVSIPRSSRVLAHTHPDGISQKFPSYSDINALNGQWNTLLNTDPLAKAPMSRVVWGPNVENITLFRATGENVHVNNILKRRKLSLLGLDKNATPHPEF